MKKVNKEFIFLKRLGKYHMLLKYYKQFPDSFFISSIGIFTEEDTLAQELISSPLGIVGIYRNKDFRKFINERFKYWNI